MSIAMEAAKSDGKKKLAQKTAAPISSGAIPIKSDQLGDDGESHERFHIEDHHHEVVNFV